MTDIIVGLIVVIIVGAALLYIRKEKKKGVVCIGCPHAGVCAKKNCGCHTEQ
ncbi:MAG: FeoB-associated Cys-rich membrane protein [Anaerotignum sp.]|nr:FeoB-associated Cys-rich membrane protein [Anaerotignum sp.]